MKSKQCLLNFVRKVSLFSFSPFLYVVVFRYFSFLSSNSILKTKLKMKQMKWKNNFDNMIENKRQNFHLLFMFIMFISINPIRLFNQEQKVN